VQTSITPGHWLQISNEEYHGSKSFSRSFLWDVLNRTPGHAFYSKQNPSEPTEAMIFGSAYHSAILEPEIFRRQYVINDVSRRTNAGKLLHEEYRSAGITCLKPDVYQQILDMQDAVMSHPIAGSLLALPGKNEESLYAVHPIFGIPLKIRVDRRLTDSSRCLDLKTANCAAPRQFRSHAFELGYHMQAGMYPAVMEMAGVEVPESPKFIFIVQEKDPPHFVAVYYADEDMEKDGVADMNRACEIVSSCIQNGFWEAYPEQFLPLGVPKWKKSHQQEF
jgi:hypothetical protein